MHVSSLKWCDLLGFTYLLDVCWLDLYLITKVAAGPDKTVRCNPLIFLLCFPPSPNILTLHYVRPGGINFSVNWLNNDLMSPDPLNSPSVQCTVCWSRPGIITSTETAPGRAAMSGVGSSTSDFSITALQYLNGWMYWILQFWNWSLSRKFSHSTYIYSYLLLTFK